MITQPREINWDRWHQLLSIRDARVFTDEERREYTQYNATAKELDAQEAALCQPYLEKAINELRKVGPVIDLRRKQ